MPRIATVRGELREPRQRVWMRSAHPLADDPLMHVCAATYASDLFLLATALPPHGVVVDDPGVMVASLDHAVWFHAPFRADDWLFYDQEGSWAGNSRALCRGSFFDRHGTLVASVVQEGLVRAVPPAVSAPPA
jgi:acyl-CoA thioesterase-2